MKDMTRRDFLRGLVTTVVGINLVGCSNTSKIRRKENDIYSHYKNIKTDNLSHEQEIYISKVKQQYGEFPVDSSEVKGLESEYLKFFEDLTGKKEFEEREFLLIDDALNGRIK